MILYFSVFGGIFWNRSSSVHGFFKGFDGGIKTDYYWKDTLGLQSVTIYIPRRYLFSSGDTSQGRLGSPIVDFV